MVVVIKFHNISQQRENEINEKKTGEKILQVEKFDGWWLVYESAPYHTRSTKTHEKKAARRKESTTK